jgi:hypothetical protein
VEIIVGTTLYSLFGKKPLGFEWGVLAIFFSTILSPQSVAKLPLSFHNCLLKVLCALDEFHCTFKEEVIKEYVNL